MHLKKESFQTWADAVKYFLENPVVDGLGQAIVPIETNAWPKTSIESTRSSKNKN